PDIIPDKPGATKPTQQNVSFDWTETSLEVCPGLHVQKIFHSGPQLNTILSSEEHCQISVVESLEKAGLPTIAFYRLTTADCELATVTFDLPRCFPIPGTRKLKDNKLAVVFEQPDELVFAFS
ncbi:hypothetical protein V3C99_012219, partial [Haemonchus contortus]